MLGCTFGNPSRLCRKFRFSGFCTSLQFLFSALDMPAKMATKGVFFSFRAFGANPVNCPATPVPKAGSADGVSSFQFQCFCLRRPSFWIAIFIAVSAEQYGRGAGTCTIVRCALLGERAHSDYRTGSHRRKRKPPIVAIFAGIHSAKK